MWSKHFVSVPLVLVLGTCCGARGYRPTLLLLLVHCACVDWYLGIVTPMTVSKNVSQILPKNTFLQLFVGERNLVYIVSDACGVKWCFENGSTHVTVIA